MNLRLGGRFKNSYNYLIFFLKERAILCLAILLVAAFITAGFVFYSYALKSPSVIPDEPTIKINQDIYQKVIRDLESRQTNIKQGVEKNYRDIFK